VIHPTALWSAHDTSVALVQVVLHRTIESMLERGEKLDTLVGKSEDLTLASQLFYKQAKKTNSCCKLM
jgi:synaptobrevin family protein YKT6